MPQGKGQHAAEQAAFPDDELSLDDLDRVVGGLNGDQLQHTESASGEGGSTPPTVPVPDHLPAQINQIEQQVTSHAITGDQAVSQIAGIIGVQPDHSMQNIAGAEIASLIGRGDVSVTVAVADLHSAVTQNHLTGDQAAGILGGMMVAQYNTAGEDTSISTAAAAEVNNLIDTGLLTADHALSAFAGLADDAGGASPMLTEINSLISHYGMTPSQVATDIGAAVDSGDLGGTQAITILASLATTFPGANHPFVAAAGQEIATLVTEHNLDPTAAMSAVTNAGFWPYGLSANEMPGVLFGAAHADPDLADATGFALGAAVTANPGAYSSFLGGVQSAVTSLNMSADETMAILIGASENGQSSWAAQAAVNLYINHAFSMTQMMTAIQDDVSTPAQADATVALMYSLATSGYASSFAPPVEAALEAMVHNHQITATQAATDLAHITTGGTAFYESRRWEMLMAVAASGAPDATSAVTAAVSTLAQSEGAQAAAQWLAGLVGGSSSVPDNAGIDAAALGQISALVSSGALMPDAAIEALAYTAATTFRSSGKEALCNEIAAIASANPQLSATQVMADVTSQVQAGAESETMLVLAFLAGHGHDLQVAAGAALLGIIDPNNFYVSNPSWVAFDVTAWVGPISTLSAESAIALLAAAVGNGSTAISPAIAGAAIADLVTRAHIAPAQVTADIHAAVVNGTLGGDAALVLLANLADNASTAQVAVNGEMLALVQGASPLVPPGHAADVINGLLTAAQTAGDTAFAAILSSELLVLASSDPATAVFNGLNPTTGDVDLDTAAAQLAAAMASGASSAATVMADIDHALANGTLTTPQAAELLVDIACHGNLAAQTAAGTEFAKIVDAAGANIFHASSQVVVSGITINVPPMNLNQTQAILSCIGLGLGGNWYDRTAASTPMNAEGALTFVLAALGSAISEPTRTAFENVMSSVVGGNWGTVSGTSVFFPQGIYGPSPMGGSLVSTINDIATTHAMPGPELIRAVFVLNNPSLELQSLISHSLVSMTDVHSAITSGWWQADDAVKVLTGLSSTPAVLTELANLISGGTIPADRFIADVHALLVPPVYTGAVPAVADYVRVMEKLATSSDAATQTALANELAQVIGDGSLDMTNVQAIFSAAGTNQSALVDQVLVALDGNDFGQLVSANLLTLDHALSVLSSHGELYDAVTHALTVGTYDAALLTNAMMQLVTNGTLSASAANTMLIQMADSADGQLATMAGALLAAIVHSGGMSAQAAMDELGTNANKYAHQLNGSVGINVPQMTNVLNSFIAHCDPASSAAAAQEAVTLSLVAYSFFPAPASAFPFVIAAAGNADTTGLSKIAGMLEGMIAQGNTTVAAVASALGGLPGANALALYMGITRYAALGGATQIISDVLAQIPGMVPGQISAASAVSALNALVGSASLSFSGAAYAAVVQTAGEDINAILTAYPQAGALSSIDDAIRAGTMTPADAAQLLVSMISGSTVSAGVAVEINSLIQQNLVAAWQMANAVVLSGTAQSQSADTIVAELVTLASVGPAVSYAVGGRIEAMIQSAGITATAAMHDINGLINQPLTIDQTVGLFASICLAGNNVITGAVADNLAVLLDSRAITAQQFTDGIAHAVTNGSASADQAVSLYAAMALTHADRSDMAVQGITALINANAISANAAFNDIRLAFGSASDHGIGFMLTVATGANATPAFQTAFAANLGALVIPDGAPAVPGYMYASDALAIVHAAYQQGLATPHAPGTLTAQQELTLLAGLLAAGANGGPASGMLPPVHAELLSLITSHAVTDTAVVAALEAVGATGSAIQLAVNTEITNLESAVGPQMLIDVAAQTGASMTDVGHQLATLIVGGNGQISLSGIMADITAATAAGHLSNAQALSMITSLLGNATGTGAYGIINSNPADVNWVASTAAALEQLAQHGLSTATISAAVEAIAGIGPALLFPDTAVALLASMAAYPDFQDAAVSHIAGMLTSGAVSGGLQLVADVVNTASTLPGHLQPADAVRLLALIAATNGSATLYGNVAGGFSSLQTAWHIAPDTVASTVEGMVQAGALTGQQALNLLVPYGNGYPATAGHAIGDLIANHSVTMAGFMTLEGGTSGVAGNMHAILLLTAMTSRTTEAVTELTTIVIADNTSTWAPIEAALMDAGRNPTTSGLSLQEVVRGLTILTADQGGNSIYGNYATHLASDIGSLIGPSLTLSDALVQVMSVTANGTQAVSDGAATIVGALLGTGPANGPDAILSAVGHGITADQAVTILTELSSSSSINLQSHIRADISALISGGQLTGAQALSDVHNASVANGITAAQELALLAGIYAASNGNGAVESAVAQAFDTLIASGRFTLGQVMDGLAQGTFLPDAVFPTQAQVEAGYLAGGLSSGAAAGLMAQVAAGSSDPAAPGAAASEIASMIAGNRMDPAQAMSGIDAAVAAGVLDPAKAVLVLASMPLNASDGIHNAAGGEIAALVSNHRLTINQAVAALVAMAHQGQAIQQMQAGAALGLLVAQNALGITTAISDIHAAVQNHTLTADQAVALLAGINADTAPGVSTAVGSGIAALIGQGEPVADVMSLLLMAAGNGMASIQAGAGAVLALLVTQNVITVAQAIAGIDTAVGSGTLPAQAATNMLLNIVGTGDASVQAAIGQEIGHIVQLSGSTAGLAAQLAASSLSQDQAVVVLAAAIAGASTSALQTQVAALIQSMVTSGPIGVAQVMSDIDSAVGHGLTATQALTALAHLEEAGIGTMRTSILTEVAALVTNHNVPAADAAAALLAAAHGGSTTLQSLVGGMLASLADHGLLTNQQVSDAIGSASALSNSEALGILFGMGVNGNAAAQAASGAGILTLILANRLDVDTVVALIDTEATQGLVLAEHALQVVLNIMGAAIGDLDANPTGTTVGYDKYIRDHMAAEVVSLTTSVAFHGPGAQATLIAAASGSVALAEAVGRSLSAMWSADQTTPNPVVRNGTPLLPILHDAVVNGQMSADEALMLALASSTSGQPQTLLTGLVQGGAVTADQAVHFLAMTAARTGDSDPTNPFLAYSGFAGPDPDLMTAAIRDLQALITGITGVTSLVSSTTVVNDIVAAALAHDLSGMQAASLLANLAGRLGASDAVVAAGAIGALVTQHQIDSESALHAIGWTVTQTLVLSQTQANLMFASMALSTDPAVQQIAVWAYNDLGGLTLAQALHAITTNAAFTHDQALTIITTIASGLGASGVQSASSVSSALAGEIASMVTSHQITADHAVAVLAGFAATSASQLNWLGVELNALIAANAISFSQMIADLTQSALSVDQMMTALTGMSAANSALDPQVLGQITAMIHAGTITLAQAMADIGNAPPNVALRLLTACGNASVDIEDAAATELAILLNQSSIALSGFYAYARANLDPVHAFGWIVSVAAHGNAALQSFVDGQFKTDGYNPGGVSMQDIATLLTNYLANFTPTSMVQYYIGQELGKLIDIAVGTGSKQTADSIIPLLEQSIAGTQARNDLATTQGSTAGSMPKTLATDTAALVLLGLTNSTHSSSAQAAANSELKAIGDAVDAKFVAAVAQIMPPQQALTQFVALVQNGWAPTVLVAKQISDMVANGSLTVQQVMTAMASLDTEHQLALVTDIIATNEVNSSVLTSQFATLVLLTWGVAPASQVYASMHDALVQVVPDFVGLVRGTTTATQAINDIKGVATAHGVAADLLMLAVYQSTTQDSGAADYASSAKGALSQIGQELYSHLTDGSAAQTVAQMVLGGALPESAAASLMQELATSATIPPNSTMLSVMNGDMSVWYADAHYPGWSNQSDEVAFTATQAVAMMHVDVHSAQDVAALLNGTMTGAQAVADILAAGAGSEYARDLGLMALVHGIEGHSGVAGALSTIDATIVARISGDTTADALVDMTVHGWLPAQQAVDFLRSEITEVTAGLDVGPASLLECIALAQLDLAASGNIDPNATAQNQMIYGGAVSHAIENILEGTDAAKILTGLGAMQLTAPSPYEMGAGLALAQNVTQVLIAQLQAQDAAHPGSTGSSTSSDWGANLPPEMQTLLHYADVAGQYFTLGMGYAQTGIHAIESVYAPAGEIADLSSHPENIQRWADLGVDLTVGGVPGAGVFNALGAGLPGWASGLQSAMLNDALGEGAGGAFTAVNIGSHVAVMVLSIPAIENGMHDHGMVLGTMKMIADSCSLISGMISGTVHTAVNMQLAMAMDTVNTFKALCTGGDAAAAAEQLGKDIFVAVTGLSFDSVAQVGSDVGATLVDIFSGNPQNLAGDAEALGMDTLKMIASNPFLQMAGSQLSHYIDQVDELVGLTPGDAMMIGFLI
jgi:hypothetical protein